MIKNIQHTVIPEKHTLTEEEKELLHNNPNLLDTIVRAKIVQQQLKRGELT